MIENLAKNLVENLVEREVIPKEETDIYLYGMDILIGTVVNFVLLFMIAAVCNSVGEAVIYTACTSPLRMYGGGYHARTHFTCGALQIVSFLMVLILSMMLQSFLPITAIIIAQSTCALIILIRAPVVHPDSYFPENRKKGAKWKCFFIQLCICGISIFCYLANHPYMATLMTFCSFAAVIPLLITNKPISAQSW